jgi:hypothetical protein
MTTFKNLETRKEFDEIVYHFNGFIEAAEEISAQMQVLDSTIGCDLERATDAMGRLEAELYTHLSYHMKELRRPLSRRFRALCKELEARETNTTTEVPHDP